MHFNINLTSLAIILWSGMLIISGSIWVLCAQIGKLSDIIEAHARQGHSVSPEASSRSVRPARVARATVRRSASGTSRRALRVVSADSRQPAA